VSFFSSFVPLFVLGLPFFSRTHVVHSFNRRPRSALPSNWNKRNSGGLAPPSHPVKRRVSSAPILLSSPSASTDDAVIWKQSESSIPQTRKEVEGSPFRMEIDGASPRNLASPVSLRPTGQFRSVSDSIAHQPQFSPGSSGSPASGADDRLVDLWGDGDGASPIPASRKRFLEQENSPTPASPTPVNNSNSNSLGRRNFEKINTIGGPIHVARRQRSAIGLNLSRRPSLASFGTVAGSFSSTTSNPSDSTSTSSNSSFNKRLATQAQDGRPSHSRRNSRRALSVADAVDAGCAKVQHSPALLGGGLFERDLNIPMESPQPAPIPADGSDYFGGSGKRGTASIDLGPAVKACMSPEAGSPIAGFREQESKGKALPCFNVKEDGLMRITPETVRFISLRFSVSCASDASPSPCSSTLFRAAISPTNRSRAIMLLTVDSTTSSKEVTSRTLSTCRKWPMLRTLSSTSQNCLNRVQANDLCQRDAPFSSFIASLARNELLLGQSLSNLACFLIRADSCSLLQR